MGEKNPGESFLGDLGVLERAIASGRETLFLTRRPRERPKDLCLCSGADCLPCEVLLHWGLPRFVCELWKVLTNAECGMRNAECGMRNAEAIIEKTSGDWVLCQVLGRGLIGVGW